MSLVRFLDIPCLRDLLTDTGPILSRRSPATAVLAVLSRATGRRERKGSLTVGVAPGPSQVHHRPEDLGHTVLIWEDGGWEEPGKGQAAGLEHMFWVAGQHVEQNCTPVPLPESWGHERVSAELPERTLAASWGWAWGVLVGLGWVAGTPASGPRSPCPCVPSQPPGSRLSAHLQAPARRCPADREGC